VYLQSRCIIGWSGTSGPRLFNALPVNIRDYNGSAEGMKKKLDDLLQIVPDHPIVPGGPLPVPLNQITAGNTNCFTDWSRHLSLDIRRRTANNFLPDNNHSAVTDQHNVFDIHSVVIEL
jgi:hypothetical protein